MRNDNDLQAELRRHNLLMPLLERQIIAEAVSDEQLSSEDLELARIQFLQERGLNHPESLDDFRIKRGWSNEDLEWQITLPLLIKRHCQKHFNNKAEAHFLTRKDQLDKVTYSLLRTKDHFLVKELYLRIDSGEANFGDLASQYAEGPERNTRGIIGPVSMTQAHPTVAELLRTTKVGKLMQPINLKGWWMLLRLESYKSACFDKSTSQQLSQELFNKWVVEEAELRMSESMLEYAQTAE